MLAGFSEVNITPAIGGFMPGQMVPYQTEIPPRAELRANAAAFTNGEESVILISMDTLSSKPWFTDDIRRRVSEATGVPTDHILVAATHTHEGAALEYQLWLCPPDPQQAALTAEKTVEAGILAWQDRKEAKLGIGKCFEERFSFCRDFYRKDGTIATNPGYDVRDQLIDPVNTEVDRSVNVMRIDDPDGKLRAFIVNFANHADTNGRIPRNAYSSDYPGFMRMSLQSRYGSNVKVLFFNGPCGDLNHFDFDKASSKWYCGKGICSSAIIGTSLAEDIIALNPSIRADVTDAPIDAISQKPVVSRRFKTQADYEWAIKELAQAEAEGRAPDAFAAEYAESDEGLSPQVPIEVHTICLGPWAIVGLPSEIYNEIGTEIKKRSPFENTVVFELANGTNGYIPPAYVVNSTAYSAKVSKYNSFCGAETADVLIEQSIKQLNELKNRQAKA